MALHQKRAMEKDIPLQKVSPLQLVAHLGVGLRINPCSGHKEAKRGRVGAKGAMAACPEGEKGVMFQTHYHLSWLFFMKKTRVTIFHDSACKMKMLDHVRGAGCGGVVRGFLIKGIKQD